MGTKPTVSLQWRTPSTSSDTPITTVTTGIQRVQWFSGRRSIADTWSAGNCIVSGIGFLATTPTVGDYARVIVTDGATSTTFYGLVADYAKHYGTTAALDTFDLTLEGPLASFGRVTVNTNWPAGSTWYYPITNLSAQLSPVQVRLPSSSYSTETISAFNNVALYGNLVYPAITTGQAVVKEVGDADWPGGTYNLSPVVNIYDRNDPNLYQLAGTLSDNGTGSRFTAVEFLSSAYSYGSKVTVSPQDVAEQTSGTGLYTQQFSSYDQTTTQALNLAGYIKVTLDSAANVPYSVTLEGASAAAGYIALSNPNKIKSAVNIILRGTTYNTVVEGMQFDADPQSWRCTLMLSSSIQNSFLRLDSTTYGKLDTGKLGM